MAQKITVDVAGEEFSNNMVIPEGWYHVRVNNVPDIKVGIDSGKKYMEWSLEVIEDYCAGIPLILRTTLDKGDDPKKSKRWLFHQAMVACKIKKVEEKYIFSLEDLNGKEFWVKVVVKIEQYKGSEFEKNEIKQIALMPSTAKKSEDSTVVSDPINEEIPF